MNFFKDLSIKYKLSLLVLVPLLLAVVFIASALYKSWGNTQNMDDAKVMLALSVASSNLVHELQKERGASAVFLATKGERFATELSDQRKLSDKLLVAFNQVLEQQRSAVKSDEKVKLLSQIEQSLKKLTAIRGQVDNLSILAKDALGYYTGQNTLLLKTTFYLSNNVKNRDIASLSSSYYYFLQGKERAGIERAIVSAVLGFDKVSAQRKERYITLAVEQSSYLELFFQKANSESIAFVKKTLSGPAIDEVNRIRRIVVLNDSNFGVDAGYWFEQATKRINLLKASEDHVAADLQVLVDEITAAETSSFIQLLVIAFILIALTVWLSLYTQHLIASQLKLLSDAMRALGEDSNLDVTIEARSGDDLGRLTQTFNATVNNIRNLIGDMRDASTQLQQVSNTLNQISGEVVLKVEKGLEETGSVAAAVDEMGSTVKDVAENCSSAASRSSEANDSAALGSTKLEAAGENMHSLIANLTETKQTIQKVADSSAEISSILDVIKSIAEQTNLLALNAAIEAARAGDQGRGFAVVADEVRSLAQKTQHSTLQIEQMISSLQDGSKNAVSAVVKSEGSAADTNQSVSAILEQLTLIVEQVQGVNDLNTQNAAATEQQTSTVHQINVNINSIQQRYVDNRDSVTKISETSGQMTELSQKLAAGVNQFTM